MRKLDKSFDEIHATGADFYGGSSVANICGLGYTTPLDEWLVRTGKKIGLTASKQMKLGKAMEPVLAELFSDATGIGVFNVDATWQHDDRDWQVYTPDAIASTGELLEFKTHRIYCDKFWTDGKASDYAMCQLQWGLDVSGYDAGYCVAIIGGDAEKFYYPRFEKDQNLIDQLVDRVSTFREFVQKDIPPVAGPGDANLIKDYLVTQTEKDRVIEVAQGDELGVLFTDLLEQYQEFQDKLAKMQPEYSAVETALKGIKNQIIAASAGAGLIKCVGKEIRISRVEVKPHEVKGSSYFRMSVK